MPHQGAGVDRSAHDLADATAEQLALIITALQASTPMQGDGHQEVDVVKTTRMEQFQSHLSSHE